MKRLLFLTTLMAALGFAIPCVTVLAADDSNVPEQGSDLPDAVVDPLPDDLPQVEVPTEAEPAEGGEENPAIPDIQVPDPEDLPEVDVPDMDGSPEVIREFLDQMQAEREAWLQMLKDSRSTAAQQRQVLIEHLKERRGALREEGHATLEEFRQRLQSLRQELAAHREAIQAARREAIENFKERRRGVDE